VWLIELGLRKIGKQAFVAAVAIDDENFLAAVAGISSVVSCSKTIEFRV
jgi:hypothetical protein